MYINISIRHIDPYMKMKKGAKNLCLYTHTEEGAHDRRLRGRKYKTNIYDVSASSIGPLSGRLNASIRKPLRLCLCANTYGIPMFSHSHKRAVGAHGCVCASDSQFYKFCHSRWIYVEYVCAARSPTDKVVAR